MEPVTLAVATATATPPGLKAAAISISTGITWAALVNSIVQLISGIAAHPITSGLAGVFLSAIWFFISGKFKAWQEKLAQNTTQQNETNFVQNQTPQNQQDNNQDNQGRKDLDP